MDDQKNYSFSSFLHIRSHKQHALFTLKHITIRTATTEQNLTVNGTPVSSFGSYAATHTVTSMHENSHWVRKLEAFTFSVVLKSIVDGGCYLKQVLSTYVAIVLGSTQPKLTRLYQVYRGNQGNQCTKETKINNKPLPVVCIVSNVSVMGSALEKQKCHLK